MSDATLQLIAFFVATSFAIVASHIGLIRLIGNANGVQAIARETPGVLIVVQFALVILICAPLPIVTKMLASPDANPFSYVNWIIPVAILILAIADMIIAKKQKPGIYYWVVVFLVVACGFGLLAANWCGEWPSIVIFLLALGLPLLVIAAQFLRSALRLAGYVNAKGVPPYPDKRGVT